MYFDDDALYRLYESYCNFGTRTGSVTGLPLLDNAKFSKLCKECRVLGGPTNVLTGADVDIFFNKARKRAERRLDYDEFKLALNYLAEKRFPELDFMSALSKLANIILASGGPIAFGTIPTSDKVVDRMTDVSLYTGAHKSRFNSDGTGRGLDGRDSVPKGRGNIPTRAEISGASNRGLDEMVRRDVNLSTGPTFRDGPATSETIALGTDPKPLQSKRRGSTSGPGSHSSIGEASSSRGSLAGSSSGSLTKLSQSSLTSGSSSMLSSARAPPTTVAKKPSKGDVYDRLTNSNSYTGAHKHRFNSDGTGRGIAGRESITKGSGTYGVYRGGDVKDLSQIVTRR